MTRTVNLRSFLSVSTSSACRASARTSRLPERDPLLDRLLMELSDRGLLPRGDPPPAPTPWTRTFTRFSIRYNLTPSSKSGGA